MVGRARTMGAGACIGALLTLALVACGGGSGGEATPSGATPSKSPGSGGIVVPIEVRLDTTHAQSGHSVWLEVGDTLEVRLETEPGSGHVWTVTSSPDKSVLKGSGDSELVPASPVPGTLTMTVFRFVAVDKGRTDLAISYAKGSGKPKRVSTFQVLVS